LELEFVEASVETVPPQKLGVAPGFHHAPLVEHHDQVGVLDRGQAVGDANGGSSLHQIF
jgi:hypothetical protein